MFGSVPFGFGSVPFGFGSSLVSYLVWGGPQARTKFVCRTARSSSLSTTGIPPLAQCNVLISSAGCDCGRYGIIDVGYPYMGQWQ